MHAGSRSSSATTRRWPSSRGSPRSDGRDFGRHAHHLYVLRVDAARAGANRDRYAEAMMAEHISTGLHFLPVHTLTWYRKHLPRSSCR